MVLYTALALEAGSEEEEDDDDDDRIALDGFMHQIKRKLPRGTCIHSRKRGNMVL